MRRWVPALMGLGPTLAVGVASLALGCRPGPSAQLELTTPRPPPPATALALDPRIEGVCRHNFEVLAREQPALSASPAVGEEFRSRCAAENQAKRSELGDQRWNERAACLERAQTAEALGICDGRTPRPPERVVVVSTVEPSVLCKHIFELMMKDMPEMKDILGPDQLEPMLTSCITDAEERRREDSSSFDRVAGCILAAETLDGLQKCDDWGD